MFKLTSDTIKELQNEPSLVRNVCVLAHVDHGKTTLTDSLIASNGIISERLAGELRYMDSREDEQQRGITMKSSAVSLHYFCENGKKYQEKYLINLIDSPGHVDFSTEVSTAVRLCDGAYIVVDVVEGAGPQTNAVLRQAWEERLRPVLVLNKIDRLFTELKLTPLAAYNQLYKVIVQVNAIIGKFVHMNVYETAQSSHIDNNSEDSKSNQFQSWSVNFDIDDSGEYFQPELGNVIFASAVDKWAFTTDKFARLYAGRMGVDEKLLLTALWGDFYFDPASKMFKTGANEKGKMPIFVKLVLENIWTVYNAAHSADIEKLVKIGGQLKLEINERRLAKGDNRLKLQLVLGKWLPLADSLLRAAVVHLPSPAALTGERIERLLSSQLAIPFKSLPERVQKLKPIFQACKSTGDVPIIIFISKLFPVPTSSLSDSKRGCYNNSNEEHSFLAFARIFSGTVRSRQKIYLIQPKYIPQEEPSTELPEFIQEIELGDLYFLMGREVEKIEEIRAGNVFGISKLDSLIFKSGTLSTTLDCPPFLPISAHSVPIVQVALEPLHPGNEEALKEGLDLLNRSDPCVEVSISNTSGEFLLRTAGEVHLHRCLADLKERFAGTELRISQPTVPFRETIAHRLPVVQKSAKQTDGIIEPGVFKMSTIGDYLTVTIQAKALSAEVTDLLERQQNMLRNLHWACKKREQGKETGDMENRFSSFKQKLKNLVNDKSVNVDNILAFAPHQNSSNILTVSDENSPLCEKNVWSTRQTTQLNRLNILSVYNSIMNGFQLAASAGPICEEPMSGVCFVIVDIKLEDFALDIVSLGSINGQTVSLIKESCRRAFSSLPQRLVAPMYSCTLQTTPETLGKLHGVISRRCGRVINEDTDESCSQFIVTSTMPVIESFGLADELRKRTSGSVVDPQLHFSHWEMIDADPTILYTPPEDEDEDDSIEAALYNQARRYMIAVRRRKGLATGEQIVFSAEKQRTLSKKK